MNELQLQITSALSDIPAGAVLILHAGTGQGLAAFSPGRGGPDGRDATPACDGGGGRDLLVTGGVHGGGGGQGLVALGGGHKHRGGRVEGRHHGRLLDGGGPPHGVGLLQAAQQTRCFQTLSSGEGVPGMNCWTSTVPPIEHTDRIAPPSLARQ